MAGVRILALVSLGALVGCASDPSRELATDSKMTYAKALKECQFAYGGHRAVQRNNLPATFAPVAACLMGKGWNSDGTASTK